MGVQTRSLTISYGGFTLGTTTYMIRDGYRIADNYDRLIVECEVVVYDTTSLRATCNALEAALSIPKQTIILSLGGSPWITANAAGSGETLGYNQEAEYDAPGSDEFDTASSRLYRITLTADRPADLSGRNGRRRANWTVDKDVEGHVVLRVSGQYTRIAAGTSASEQFVAHFLTAGYGDSIAAAVGGVGAVMDGPVYSYTADDPLDDHTCSFTATWTKRIYSGFISALTHSSLVRPQLVIIPSDTGIEASLPGTRPFRILTARFQAGIKRSVTEDLATLWTGTIWPFIVNKLQSQPDVRGIAVKQIEPHYDFEGAVLSATVVARAYVGGTYLASAVVTRDTENLGWIFEGVYGAGPHAKQVDQGEATLIRLAYESVLEFGGQADTGQPLTTADGEQERITGFTTAKRLSEDPLLNAFFSGSIEGRFGSVAAPLTRPPSEEFQSKANGSGKFVAFYRDSTVQPIEDGITPYQLRWLRRDTVTMYHYVEDPPTVQGGSRKRSGSDGGHHTEVRTITQDP